MGGTYLKVPASDWNLVYSKLQRAYSRTKDPAIRQAGIVLGFDWARCLK